MESDRGLKDILVAVVNKHLEAIMQDDTGKKVLLKDVLDFAYDLLMARADCLPTAAEPDEPQDVNSENMFYYGVTKSKDKKHRRR